MKDEAAPLGGDDAPTKAESSNARVPPDDGAPTVTVVAADGVTLTASPPSVGSGWGPDRSA